MSESAIKFFLMVIIMGVLFGGVALYKGCAPQSGFTSRLGGKAVQLDTPDDCKQIIMIGKTAKTKYVSYIDKQGNYRLKEFSDYGLLEAEYIMKPPKTVESE